MRTKCLSFALAGVMLLAGCAPKHAANTVATAPPEVEAALAEADEQASKGSYLALKQALADYGKLYVMPGMAKRVQARYLEICIQLDIREKSLGLAGTDGLDAARRLLGEARGSSLPEACYRLATAVGSLTRGIVQDISMRVPNKDAMMDTAAAKEILRRYAYRDRTAAVVLAAYDLTGAGLYEQERIDPVKLAEAYPDSPAVRYEIAVCREDEAALISLLQRFPALGEIHYHLGLLALNRGAMLEAEDHFLAALPAVPDSPQTPIMLAAIHFACEEFETSLAYYDRALAVEPQYRDALLGRAVCLSYMGRHDEAIAMLEGIINMGYWLIGESHYWIAWNLFEKGVREGRMAHIEEAMKRLPTDAGVFCLGGRIAQAEGDRDKAEKYFLESLANDPAYSEALFGLGEVMTARADWPRSVEYFEKAGASYAAAGLAVRKKIEELSASAMAERRKAAMIARKKNQLDGIMATAAVSYYDGAAAAVNMNARDKAAALAEKALAHPSVRDKALELLKTLKK